MTPSSKTGTQSDRQEQSDPDPPLENQHGFGSDLIKVLFFKYKGRYNRDNNTLLYNFGQKYYKNRIRRPAFNSNLISVEFVVRVEVAEEMEGLVSLHPVHVPARNGD